MDDFIFPNRSYTEKLMWNTQARNLNVSQVRRTLLTASQMETSFKEIFAGSSTYEIFF